MPMHHIGSVSGARSSLLKLTQFKALITGHLHERNFISQYHQKCCFLRCLCTILVPLEESVAYLTGTDAVQGCFKGLCVRERIQQGIIRSAAFSGAYAYASVWICLGNL